MLICFLNRKNIAISTPLTSDNINHAKNLNKKEKRNNDNTWQKKTAITLIQFFWLKKITYFNVIQGHIKKEFLFLLFMNVVIKKLFNTNI